MKKAIIDNIGLKITAVILSLILWVFVTSRGQSEVSLDVPIEFRNIPPGLEIVSQSAKVIGLNMRGQERLLKNIRPTDLAVSLDLSNAKPGENTFYIHRDDVRLPSHVTVSNINPSSVKVVTEETMRKTVKIVPIVIGEPEKEFIVKSVTVTPPTIEVEGVKRELSRIHTVKTEAIDVTGMTETFSQDLRLDMSGRSVRAKTAVVTAQVVIGAKSRKR